MSCGLHTTIEWWALSDICTSRKVSEISIDGAEQVGKKLLNWNLLNYQFKKSSNLLKNLSTLDWNKTRISSRIKLFKEMHV